MMKQMIFHEFRAIPKNLTHTKVQLFLIVAKNLKYAKSRNQKHGHNLQKNPNGNSFKILFPSFHHISLCFDIKNILIYELMTYECSNVICCTMTMKMITEQTGEHWFGKEFRRAANFF